MHTVNSFKLRCVDFNQLTISYDCPPFKVDNGGVVLQLPHPFVGADLGNNVVALFICDLVRKFVHSGYLLFNLVHPD